MKIKVKILAVLIVPILMIVLGLMFAIKYKNESVKYFNKSGYIISNSKNSNDTESVDKIYFDSSSSYVEHSNGEVSFTNTSGNKSIVKADSFVHYEDESIMALTNGVAIDLEHIDSKLLSYYNIFSNSTLLKTKDGYEIENMDSNINFKKLLYKISGNKYLIGADNIIAVFSDDQTVTFKDFVEVEYVNENVIRIYNDEVNYQTIASGLYLLVNDIKIDLEYKTISKNNIEYLTMADLVINSNDNIEVLPTKDPDDKEENNNTTNNNNSNSNSSNSNNQDDNPNIDSNVNDALNNIISNVQGSDRLDNKENIIQPKFMVESLDVTPLGFENLKISFVDESSVLSGAREVQLIENSTGKIIYTFEPWNEGDINYFINSYNDLKPNKEYTINVVGKYKIENEEYDRIFVTKMFRTLDLGLEITDDYLTSDSLSFSIYKKDYLDILGFDYEIIDSKEKVLKQGEISFGDNDKVEISLSDGVKPNSEYSILIKKIQYSNIKYELSKKSWISHSTKSLKEKPNKNVELLYKLNSSKRLLTLSLDGVNDPNGGIISYTYKVYDSDTNELIYSSIKDKYTDLVLTIGDSSTKENNNTETLSYDLEINKSYYYQVEILFDDNEKTIIYLTPKSEAIYTGDIIYPRVIGYKDSEEEHNSETLNGAILVDNSSNNYTNFIESRNISRYQVVLQERQGSLLTSENIISMSIVEAVFEQNNEVALPVYFYGLKPNTEYSLYVYLIDSNGTSFASSIYIGKVYAKTSETRPIELELQDINSDKLFAVSVNSSDKNSSELVSSIELELYKCSYGEDGEHCEKLNDYKRTIPKSQNDNEELNNLFENGIDVTSDDFSFYLEDYSLYRPDTDQYFKLKATSVAHQGYTIPVKINGNDSYKLHINNIPPKFTNLNISEVQKEECDDCNNISSLDAETVVAYKFEVIASPSVQGKFLETLYFHISKVNTEDDCTSLDLNNLDESKFLPFSLNSGSKSFSLNLNSNVEVDNGKFDRGSVYCVYYYGEYQDENETIRVVDDANSGVQVIKPLKQKPRVTGYVSNYDGKNITFKLKINDPDGAGEKVYLTNNNFSKGKNLNTSMSEYSEYSFDGISAKNQYTLKLQEKLLSSEDASLIPIYDTNELDDIVDQNPEYKLVVDTSVVNKVTFKLYLATGESEIQGADSSKTLPSNTSLDRVYKLKLKTNDNKYEYLELKEAEDYYYSTISLDKVKDFIKAQDGKEFLNLDGKLEILYEKGSIIDYVSTNSYLLKGVNDPFKYFKLLEGELKPAEGIKSASDFIFNTSGKNYIEIKNNQVGLFTKQIHDNDLSQLVYSKEILNSNPILFNTDYKKANEFEVNNSLATSAIETTYTTSGAIAKFEILNYDSEKLQIVLNDDAEELEKITFDFGDNKCDNSKICITSDTTDNKKIIKIEFINLEYGRQYNYSINYLKDNITYIPTYNVDLQSQNLNISISSLSKLKYSNKSVLYNKGEWKYDDKYSNITHDKKIIGDFNIVENYILDSGESIKYSIIAVNDSSKEIALVSDIALKTSNEFSLDYEQINKLGLNGQYTIKIKPNVYENGVVKLELLEETLGVIEVTNQNPQLSIGVSEETKIELSIEDPDGLLTECNECSEYDNELIYDAKPELTYSPYLYIVDENNKTYLNIPNKITEKLNFKDKKVVHFELYKLPTSAEESKKLVLYSPVTFVNKTSIIDISKLMQYQKLSSGSYKVIVRYCDKTGAKTKELDITINNNATSLNMGYINLLAQRYPSYLISFYDPPINILNKIEKMDYQYGIENNYYFIENAEVVFAQSTDENGKSTYSLLVPISEYKQGDNLTSLVIKFKGKDNKVIATYHVK